MRLWSYLMAPVSEKYVFVTACDDDCVVYLSTSTARILGKETSSNLLAQHADING